MGTQLNSKYILVGSRYFFTGIPGYYSKDYDYIRLVKNQTFNDYRYRHFGNLCLFEYSWKDANWYVNNIKQNKNWLELGAFLNPEFCELLGIDMKFVKTLAPMFKLVDKKHTYIINILNAYIKNNGMFLTDDQKKEIFDEYKKLRPEIYLKKL